MQWLTPAAQDYVVVMEKAGYEADDLSAETARIATAHRSLVTTDQVDRVVELIRQRKLQEARER